ncbi:MAG: hypothetical protein IJS15_01430 [Victivallales bacterium]|nr:hypothetical protein [Victivallales bacterium]
MRVCADCQKFRNDVCTEDGAFATPGGTCDKWRYRYEPLVFAVERMRKAQKAKCDTRAAVIDRDECEKYVDDMLREIEETGEIKTKGK